MKSILFITVIIFSNLAIAQKTATTEDGKKVKLLPDGTWVMLEDENIENQTSSVYIGGKRLISGKSEVIHKERYGGMTTSISVAKEGDKTLIIFWQDTKDEQMNFFNWVWKGTVILYLENGETISLVDRNMKGQNKLPDYIFQRFSTYYLTSSECEKLKKSGIQQIAYQTTSSFEEGTTYLTVTENKDTIKRQLIAIRR